jgi:hypothetical protein
VSAMTFVMRFRIPHRCLADNDVLHNSMGSSVCQHCSGAGIRAAFSRPLRRLDWAMC